MLKSILIAAILIFQLLPLAAKSDGLEVNCSRSSTIGKLLEMDMNYLLPRSPRVVIFSATSAAMAKQIVDGVSRSVREVMPVPEFSFSSESRDDPVVSVALYERFDVVVMMDSEFLDGSSPKYESLMFDAPKIRPNQRIILSLSDANPAVAPQTRKAFIQITEDVDNQKQVLLLELSLAVAALPELTGELNYTNYVFEVLKAPAVDAKVLADRQEVVGDCAGPVIANVYTNAQ